MEGKIVADLTFWILNPRKKKKLLICEVLSDLGNLKFVNVCRISLSSYPEALPAAVKACENSINQPKNKLHRYIKIAFYWLQYNGLRRNFEKNNKQVVCVWNGLNGTRFVAGQAARDASCRTLFFELSPFKNTLTIDPAGVNYANSLPKKILPYLKWYNNHVECGKLISKTLNSINQRNPAKSYNKVKLGNFTDKKYIFVPLQVPGDSQLRIYGGKFKELKSFIDILIEYSSHLPKDWYIRFKEHPNSKISYLDHIKGQVFNKPIMLDNQTDTFEQVRSAEAVMTINSSVGLEAMYFEKKVIACGQCFWAFDGLAKVANTRAKVKEVLSNPQDITFNKMHRKAFLSYIIAEYFILQDLKSLSTSALEMHNSKILSRINNRRVKVI